jgi:hypothetical protein
MARPGPPLFLRLEPWLCACSPTVWNVVKLRQLGKPCRGPQRLVPRATRSAGTFFEPSSAERKRPGGKRFEVPPNRSAGAEFVLREPKTLCASFCSSAEAEKILHEFPTVRRQLEIFCRNSRRKFSADNGPFSPRAELQKLPQKNSSRKKPSETHAEKIRLPTDRRKLAQKNFCRQWTVGNSRRTNSAPAERSPVRPAPRAARAFQLVRNRLRRLQTGLESSPYRPVWPAMTAGLNSP